MGNTLKSIIDQQGKDILNNPTALEEAMRQNGCKEKDIFSILLILNACPSVAGLLTRQEPTRTEIQSLVRSCCALSGLNTGAVRYALGLLLHACGYAPIYAPRLTVWRLQDMFIKVVPEPAEEVAAVTELSVRLSKNPDDSAALSDLYALAQSGSAQAAYALGCYFNLKDGQEGTKEGLSYFKQAAQLGYGPANGALADYYVNSDKKYLSKAAACFENPTALYGREGRRWSFLSRSLLQYRKENTKRLWSVFTMQAVSLVLSLFLVILMAAPEFLSVTAVLIQALSLLWTLFCIFIKPYYTSRITSYAMIVSWLLLSVSIL